MLVLAQLEEAHEVPFGEGALMFGRNFHTDEFTLRQSNSRSYSVRMDEDKLCDLLNATGETISRELVIATLGTIYQNPERFGAIKIPGSARTQPA